MVNPRRLHSVTLDESRCKGCTNCLKGCPTEAIRVRDGRAWIMDERCIDCGDCIRRCPHRAKKALTSPLSDIERFDYKVALPAPSLYGQFEESWSVDEILAALQGLGFTSVFEVALAAGIAARATADFLRRAKFEARPGPFISSSCPAVLRLLQVRFPSLLGNVIPMVSPMEIAARAARRAAVHDPNYRQGSSIGVFFISPCAAKATDLVSPMGVAASSVDGVISFKDIYLPLRNALSANRSEGKVAPKHSRSAGISWARIDGESESIGVRRRISVDGIDHVIDILEAVENGKLRRVDFIEAMACAAGCVGGPLVVENPYIARVRILNREKDAEPSHQDVDEDESNVAQSSPWQSLEWTTAIESRNGLGFDADLGRALAMESEMERLAEDLPGLDCGSCGAPSCRALAEDVVKGKAAVEDCIIEMRKRFNKQSGS